MAVELVVVFAGFGLPGADAALGAAQLDDVGKLGHAGDAPVESVAAEIGELAPGVGVVLQRVQRAKRVVFGVRAGEHGAVGREQGVALVVEVFIGDDVEGDALGFEPGEQMRVGGVVPQAGAGGSSKVRKPGRMVRIGRRREEMPMPLLSAWRL